MPRAGFEPTNPVFHSPRITHYGGCEVRGIILLRDLKEAMRLGHSKDMSVHVSTCTTYDLKALTSVVLKL